MRLWRLVTSYFACLLHPGGTCLSRSQKSLKETCVSADRPAPQGLREKVASGKPGGGLVVDHESWSAPTSTAFVQARFDGILTRARLPSGTNLAGGCGGSLVSAGRSILVVEDEPLVCLDFTEWLQCAGATVLAASHLDKALSLADHPLLSAGVLDFDLRLGDSTAIC